MVRFVVPALLGFAGGLLGHYLGWDVRRRASRHERRQNLVDDIRRQIAADWPPTSRNMAIVEGEGIDLCKSEPYARIRGHLSEDLRRRLEGGRDTEHPTARGHGQNISVTLGGNARLRGLLLDEITALERKWKLI